MNVHWGCFSSNSLKFVVRKPGSGFPHLEDFNLLGSSANLTCAISASCRCTGNQMKRSNANYITHNASLTRFEPISRRQAAMFIVFVNGVCTVNFTDSQFAFTVWTTALTYTELVQPSSQWLLTEASALYWSPAANHSLDVFREIATIRWPPSVASAFFFAAQRSWISFIETVSI